MMKAASRKILLPALVATVIASAFGPDDAAAESSGQRPTLLYGENISFDIFRGGSKIDSHTVNFTESHGRLTVTAATRLRIGPAKLGLTGISLKSPQRRMTAAKRAVWKRSPQEGNWRLRGRAVNG